ETRRPTRGRSRGPGRWTRSTPLAPEFRNPQTLPEGEPAAEGVSEAPPDAEPIDAAPAISVESPREAATLQAPLPAPEAIAETASPEPAAAAPPGKPEPSHAARSEVVITEADPSAPKKAGWWRRARETFGG